MTVTVPTVLVAWLVCLLVCLLSGLLFPSAVLIFPLVAFLRKLHASLSSLLFAQLLSIYTIGLLAPLHALSRIMPSSSLHLRQDGRLQVGDKIISGEVLKAPHESLSCAIHHLTLSGSSIVFMSCFAWRSVSQLCCLQLLQHTCHPISPRTPYTLLPCAP